MKIGIIDSGLGGLGYLKLFFRNTDSYILIMDEAFFPYGGKSETFLRLRSLFLVEYLLKAGADRIILACNTLSVVALPFVKSFYPQVEGIFSRIEPYLNDKEALLLGSKRLIKHIKADYSCFMVDAQEFIIKIQEQNPLDLRRFSCYDTVILGCTHFLFCLEAFADFKKVVY